MECSRLARLTSGTSAYTVTRTVRLLTRCAAASHGAGLLTTLTAIAVTPCTGALFSSGEMSTWVWMIQCS